jgi:hypothetical protein
MNLGPREPQLAQLIDPLHVDKEFAAGILECPFSVSIQPRYPLARWPTADHYNAHITEAGRPAQYYIISDEGHVPNMQGIWELAFYYSIPFLGDFRADMACHWQLEHVTANSQSTNAIKESH